MARTLTRWDPFQDLANMRNAFDRLLTEPFPRLPARNGEEFATGTLGIDVYETPTEMVVKAAVPGTDPKDVEISVEEDVLTIKGESRHEEESNEDNFLRRELRYGAFHRALRLPPTVDPEKATATFEHGMLKLTLPKKPEARARSIKITPQGVVEGEQHEAAQA
jgi:HSP20 family protein